MKTLRKLNREKQHNNARKKAKQKLTFFDILLGLGIAMIIAGIIFSFYYYLYYIAGRPEGIISTKEGIIPLEKIESGDTNYKEMSKFCAIIAFIGLIISGISLIAKDPKKQTQNQH